MSEGVAAGAFVYCGHRLHRAAAALARSGAGADKGGPA